MTDPTMSSMTTYGSMDVSSVRVHGPITQDNHATTKQYVDQSAAAVREGILGVGVSEALDTLKELEVYLTGEQNMSGGLISQISSIQNQVTQEVSRASSAEGALLADLQHETGIRNSQVQNLQTALNYEAQAREANVVSINAKTQFLEDRMTTLTGQHEYQEARFDTEYQRATAAESALSANLATSVVEVNTRVDTGLALKLDKTGGVLSGDLNLVGGLLYIGPNWRIVAVGQSLEFQFSASGGEDGWSTGIPFISV